MLLGKADALLALNKQGLDELIHAFNADPKTDRATLRGMAMA